MLVMPQIHHTLARVSVVAAVGGFLFGYDTAVINGATQYLAAHFKLTSAEEGFAVSSAILGCIPGALVAGILSDRLGRKSVLFLCATLFLLSGIASALPNSFPQFLVARFAGGIAIGICSMVCPVYIAECAPAQMRGRLGSLFQLGIVVGILLTLFINFYVQGQGDVEWNTNFGWRWVLGSEALPASLLLYLLKGAPESPRWLIQRGQEERAREILVHWETPSAVEHEIDEVRAVAARGSGRLSDLLEPRLRRPLLIAVGLAAIAQLSGINAVMYYSTRIFMSAGVGVDSAFIATVLVGLVNLIFTLVALYFVDRAGRRPLLIVGLAAQVLSLSAVAWFLGAHARGVGLLFGILVFIASFALALGPIPWLMSSEIFPARIRGRAMSVAAFTVWVSCAIVAQAFPMLNDSPSVGPSNTFWIFAAVSLLGLIFSLLVIPETKGRTLEEIDALWSAPKSALKSGGPHEPGRHLSP